MLNRGIGAVGDVGSEVAPAFVDDAPSDARTLPQMGHGALLQRALIAACPAFLALMAWRHRWTADDAFVNFRIVKQMEAGHGPVFNAGERVEAATSPLWTFVLFVGDVVSPLRLEWIAVLLGLALTVTGLLLAERGAWLALVPSGHSLVVPFGALVLVALPPMWDFATSGLETGLGFAWLGACFWALARCYRRRLGGQPSVRSRAPVWTALLIGLGPVVRPDFAIYSVAFVAALFIIEKPVRRSDRVKTVAAVLAVPVVSELFRMAYYASLVPNTALTKESSRAYWRQGWSYMANFNRPYLLWLPVLVVLLAIVVEGARAMRARNVRWLALVGAPVVGASLHALYVVRVGGDFMHARFLLPATFALLMSVAVVPLRGWRWLSATIVVVWALVCIHSFREPFHRPFTIVDERRYWIEESGVEHPVVVDDYSRTPGYQRGTEARLLSKRGERGLDLLVFGTLPLAPDVRQRVVVQVGTVGVSSYRSPTDVYVIDTLGLGDPLASRLQLVKRGRPGHEKLLSSDWMVARFGVGGRASVEDARHALSCGALHELLIATSGPLGFTDALGNLARAPRLTSLRFSMSPPVAERELCNEVTRRTPASR